MELKALEIKNLSKSFKSDFLIKTTRVLKDVSFSVDEGEIFGFLGPNGAGKTTTIKCMLGLLFPDSGTSTVFGEDSMSEKGRRKIGFLPEHPYFYDYLTPEELLKFTAGLFDLPKTDLDSKITQLLTLVGLKGKEKIKLRKFSKGMVQRAGFAQALIHDPSLIIFDEPFSGLDPIGRKELRDIILNLREEGKTVFFSSHILQDMEMIADTVGIILNGEIRRQGKISDLLSKTTSSIEIVYRNIDEAFPETHGIKYSVKDGYMLTSTQDHDEKDRIVKLITENGGNIISVTQNKMTLEDIFIKETDS